MLVGFANSFVWQFAGPDTNYAASVINFSLLQPLLRGGGRDVILEQLTRAERSLLAALRSQAQYRQDFTRNIAVGGTVTAAPRRIGGFQGGAGLSGFTGTGQGGFGGVGEGQNFGTTGANRNNAAGGGGAASGFAGGGEGTVAGFYGLAQRIQAIRNTQNNLANQLLTLGLLESLADAGLIDTVQVDEFRQNVETERANLLRVQVSLQDTLEFYLLDVLGLPPTLRIAIDDTILKQFEFVDEAQFTHQRFANDLLRKAGGLAGNADDRPTQRPAERRRTAAERRGRRRPSGRQGVPGFAAAAGRTHRSAARSSRPRDLFARLRKPPRRP